MQITLKVAENAEGEAKAFGLYKARKFYGKFLQLIENDNRFGLKYFVYQKGIISNNLNCYS